MTQENDYIGGLLRHYVERQGDEDYWKQKIDLFDGEVQGFQVGDQVEFSDACYSEIRGKRARIAGFDRDFRVWTQAEGESGFRSTPREFVREALVLIAHDK